MLDRLALPRPLSLPVPTMLPVVAGIAAAGLIWGAFQPASMAMLVTWMPYLAKGFGMNIVISLCAVTIGTLLGLVLGALELSRHRLVRLPAVVYVQLFRNAPHLVLIFATTYIFPFEIMVGALRVPFPDWMKATIGLAIPASAYVAEIVRGAMQSIPTAQWEAATGLGFSRSQTLRWIILPQCVKRALPPWMNLYASITMGTALASLVGVNELLHAATDASTAVQKTDFTVAIYLTVLICFFAYCYPVARFTQSLERRFAAR